MFLPKKGNVTTIEQSHPVGKAHPARQRISTISSSPLRWLSIEYGMRGVWNELLKSIMEDGLVQTVIALYDVFR